MTRERALDLLAPWILVLLIFIVWEAACLAFDVSVFVLPRPTVIAAAMVQFWEPITQHSLHTLFTTILGFAFAVGGGVLLGIAIGSSRLVYRALFPVLIAFNAIPKVAVVPVIIIWTGIGTVPAIITAFLVAFFPIVVNVATGLATVEPELRDVMRSLGASHTDMLAKVGLPRSLPYFFASLKISVTLAFVGAIISETIGSNEGVGYLMLQASSRFQVPLLFAGLLVVAAMGVAMYAVFAWLEGRMTGWATRGQDGAQFAGGG